MTTLSPKASSRKKGFPPRQKTTISFPLLLIIIGLLVRIRRYVNFLRIQETISLSYHASPEAKAKLAQALQDLQRLENLGKNVSSLILDIGSNNNPIMPRQKDGPCALSIAFEPIVPQDIPPHPQLRVFPLAVAGNSSTVGLDAMIVYNKGASSSFSKVRYKSRWNQRENDGRNQVVSVVSIAFILHAVGHYPIALLMTDLQGHDFAAIQSAGHLLVEKGVKRIVTEVFFDDETAYEGVHNDFCRDWLPYMKSIGYVYEGSRPYVKFRKEHAETKCKSFNEANGPERQWRKGQNKGFDAFWRLSKVPSMGKDEWHEFTYPYHSINGKRDPLYHEFSGEDYATCGWM
jgi:hypothetical protein